MKRFFMSYSHPVLTTTIVSLPGPHVSHHQWDPNVADKIILLSLCYNHIPPLFQILLCLPLLGNHTHTDHRLSLLLHTPSPSYPTCLCLSYQLIRFLFLFLRSQLFGAGPVFLARPPSTIYSVSKCLLRVTGTLLGTRIKLRTAVNKANYNRLSEL